MRSRPAHREVPGLVVVAPGDAGPAAPRPADASQAPAAQPETARALFVGARPSPGLMAALRRVVAVECVGGEEALARLTAATPAVLLLDAAITRASLRRILESLGPPGAAGRPAVLILGGRAGGGRVPPELAVLADEIVGAAMEEDELLFRVRSLLRTHRYLGELSRKNGELAELYARLEGLAGRMAEELRLAGNVQRSLLPPPLHHPGVEVAAEFIPVREIGGDYYDLIPLGPRTLAFAIGDVMGKGVPAALLSANLKACLRAQLQAAEMRTDALVARVNRLFWEVTPKGLFASLFFGVLDLEQHRLEFVNAGHDPPFLVTRKGEVRDLVAGGTVLGLVEDSRYEQATLAVGPEDLIVLYSDGVTDRVNGAGDMYGVEKLKDAALRSRRDGARIALYTLLGDIQGFSSGAPAEDDMTLVVGRVL